MEETVNENEYLFYDNLNFTDPLVYHDPEKFGSHIVKLLEKQHAVNYDKDGNLGSFIDHDPIKVEGIYQPIIQVNNTVLSNNQIDTMELNYDSFYPELYLNLFYGPARNIEFNDTPGMNNIVKLILIPPVDGAYKKIALDFKIIDYSVTSDSYYLYCRMNIPDLASQRTKSIEYNGCSNTKGDDTKKISCNPNPNIKPNTWEYLHEIANECGLGFASTDNCKDIEDRLPRLLCSTSYEDFIKEQITFGGLDEDSIFDVWIDLYGYLTVVNIPWVLGSDVSPKNLSLKVYAGIPSTDSHIENNVNILETNRTITNFNRMSTKTNVEIKEYKWIVDNSFLNNVGNLHTLYTFTLEGVQDASNTVGTHQVEVIEDSVDGQHVEDYEISKCLETAIEVNEYNINVQKMIRNQFFGKIKSKLLKVELTSPNLGIQRGTLINVAIYESDPIRKSKLLNQSGNLIGEYTDEMNSEQNLDMTNEFAILNEDVMVPNLSISGLYYVYSMKFTYNTTEDNRLSQILYLYKKGTTTNIDNKYTLTRVNDLLLEVNDMIQEIKQTSN